MTEAIWIAAGNNADLCAAIFRAHGLRFERDDRLLRCLDAPPPFYPGIVTLHPDVDPDEILGLAGRGAVAIKDSFATLDPTPLGCVVLSEACWIECDPCAGAMPEGWGRVEDPAAFSAWRRTWRGDAGPDADCVFPDPCLEAPDLAFLARWEGARMRAGCLANLSEAVVGLSNVFGLGQDPSGFAQALHAAGSFGGARTVVGYENGDRLTAARAAGFREIGCLRILVPKDGRGKKVRKPPRPSDVHSRGPVYTGGRQVTRPGPRQSQLPRNCLRPPEFRHMGREGQ
ncbi:hypothetical protein [Jannaschia aquimarina]|uniref:Uncharacterized protein n=1 Tax=Jannaschia aquimarina TaxID=935700 RepID=A0A0D1CPH5_9RHOB|nr:hypothetical protein [Jannaschia aquimarina]KIT16662.1 hypothetical protein jaqu_16290 [Jannaschia aquimarina]SNS93009.1 hypothetical protein SAMN05421775_103352 [Jannaschia aquimarina]